MKKTSSLLLLLSLGLTAHTVFSAEQSTKPVSGQDYRTAQLGSVVSSYAGAPKAANADKGGSEKNTATELPASDLAGLRYFAQIGDEERSKKEIERLQRLYPRWKPPENLSLLSSGTDAELERMWQLFAQERFPELRKAIDERKQAQPDWTPPDELLQKLAKGESKRRLVNASRLEQYALVIQIAAENSALLTCANVEILWRLAEAFTKESKDNRAKDAYFYVLKNCDDPSERIATIRKAIDLLPSADVDQLISEERLKADGKGEFAEIQNDLARVSLTRSLKKGSPAVPDDLKKIEELAETERSQQDALLLGWYFLEQKNYNIAESWFSKASRIQPSAEAAQGLGLAMLKLGKLNAAEKELRPWWKETAKSQADYLAAASSVLAAQPKVEIGAVAFETIVEAATTARDAKVAQQIGWYAYNLDQLPAASQWFQVALNWAPGEEPAAYGYALSLRKLGDRKKLDAFAKAWADRSQRIAAFTSGSGSKGRTGATPGVVTRRSGRVGSQCAAFSPGSRESANRSLSQGWCLLNKNRPLEAAHAFANALSSRNERERSDAAYGQSLAYLRLGLINKAFVASTNATLSSERVRELQLDLLSKKAGAAFESGRYLEAIIALDERKNYGPERADLMLLRGYAYMQMRRLPEAMHVFEALVAAGHNEASKGIATVIDLRKAALDNDDS